MAAVFQPGDRAATLVEQLEGAAIHHAARDATLLGRVRERARLEEVVDGARRGRSAALVLRGEPGIGVESEAELELSALLEVCRPLLHRLTLLPRRQADALSGALGIGPAEAVDRLAIGAATIGLLTAAAEQAPVLVLVDDAQWLDRSSADALLFAAWRLEAERGPGRRSSAGWVPARASGRSRGPSERGRSCAQAVPSYGGVSPPRAKS